jgi:hypothetical protein
MRLHAALLLAFAGTALSGCGTNVGRYFESRGLDLYESVPISVAYGLGLMAQVRATPFAGIGIGYADVTRFGMDDTRYGPVWTEKERGFPVVMYYRVQHYLDRTRRFAGGEPHWRGEDYRARASSWIVIPGFPRDGDFVMPLPGPLDPPGVVPFTYEPWLAALPAYVRNAPWHYPDIRWWELVNVEAGVVLGPIGLRVGVSGLQLVDFVLGIFLLDFPGDDVRNFPVIWPDPHARPSFEPAPADAGGKVESAAKTDGG